jgi:hypothetical protein
MEVANIIMINHKIIKIRILRICCRHLDANANIEITQLVEKKTQLVKTIIQAELTISSSSSKTNLNQWFRRKMYISKTKLKETVFAML